MARSTLCSVLCVLLGLPLAGCDIEDFFGVRKREKPPSYTVEGDGRNGGGDGDSGNDEDGGTGDAGPGDGGTTLAPNEVPECVTSTTEEDWSDIVSFPDENGFSLTRGQVGFGLAYRPLVMTYDEIHAAEVPSTGGIPILPVVFGENSGFVIRDLSVVYSADVWRIAWTDNSTGTRELHVQTFGENLDEPTGQRMQLSDNKGLDERSPMLADLLGRPIVGWITENSAEDTYTITTRMVDGEHPPQTIVEMDDQQRPTKLAIAQMGIEAGAIAWVNETGAQGVWLNQLDPDGKPVGSPTRLTQYAGSGATVDLTTRNRGSENRLGGAAVYSISIGGSGREVQYRRLDPQGAPTGVERTVVGLPLRGMDASIAELGGGYVVVYRALPGGGIDSHEIRMMFVSREGDLNHDAFGRPNSEKIADATAAQARVTVRISNDGQMLISWMDVDDQGNTVLKLSRKRLDCR